MNNDIILIRALKNGEERAYAILVEHYHHKLCAYAHSLIHDKVLAEDIVQNVYIRVWRKRKKLKTEFSIKSFLLKSVYNEFIDQYRKSKKVIPLENKYLEVLNDYIEMDESTTQKLFLIVQKEIQNLPPKSKNVFILSKQEGLTNMEIAEHLNLSLKSVEGHITRSFCLLRAKLNEKVNIEVLLFLFFRKTSLFIS